MDDLVVQAPPNDEGYFRARMTQIQFASLRCRCAPSVVANELANLQYRRTVTATKHCELNQIVSWLRNGWNTEYLLGANRKALEGEALRHSLQWAFPQAYYSVYAVALAFFKAVGFTETSHAAVIWKIGDLMTRDCYPTCLGFVAKGGKTKTFQNIAKGVLASPLYFDESDQNCVNTHICQFLNGTRRVDLNAKKGDLKLRTKSGKVKKQFTDADWDIVSEKLGATSIFSLFYRKRIKANYRDIETFISEHLQADLLYDDLISVVFAMNLAHEAFVAKAIGAVDYATACRCLPHEFILERANTIAALNTQDTYR